MFQQGATWRQAVQWMPAQPVKSGQELEIIAKHDTYGLSFSFRNSEELVSMVRSPQS
jgi:hypothetical protein